MTYNDPPRPFGLVFDLETTDRDPHEARIVTAFIAMIDTDGEVIRQKDYLVNPGVHIPEETTAIHGVTDEMAAAGQHPAVAVADIAAIIQLECLNSGLPLIGQNVSYDLTVLLAEVQRHLSDEASRAIEDVLRTVNVLDTYVIDKHVDKFRRGKRTLVDMSAHYGVELSEEDAHGAAADALAAGRIALAIMARHPQVSTLATPPNVSYALLHEAQQNWRAQQQASLQAWFRSKAPAESRDPNIVIDGSWPIQVRSAA